jgi:2',3'-cyclic-nucleotide 2'-phosphodiesterase (5'-nucleotidase family)
MMVLAFITPINVLAEENVGGQAKNLISEDKANVAAVANEDGSVELQILATTDVHGRFMPYDYAVNAADVKGSLTKVLTEIRKYREQNPENTILVDAGDTIQDNSAELFLNDENNPMMVAMNAMGYDVWTLGNHEFNCGVPTLEKVMAQFKGKVLCGNVYKPDGSRLAAPYTIVERSGVKVGIIGMVTPNITKWDAANLKGYTVTSPVDEAKAAVSELKDKVDIMIAVNHMGVNARHGDESAAIKAVAEACPELSAIVCGHDHNSIAGDYYYKGEVIKGEEASEEVKANGVLVVMPYKWGRALSQIKINLVKKDGKYVVEDKASNIISELHFMKEIEEDKELVSELQQYHKKAVDDAEQIIGELRGGNLVPEEEIKGIPTAKVQETAMIALINKVQMHYGEVLAGEKIDVASAAAFRDDANMKEGQIQKCGTSLIYKYPNTLYVLKITGKQLKTYMEWSAGFYNTFKEGDLTISFNPEIRGYNYDMFSGVDYEIDISKEPGNRIVNLTKDGKPIEDNQELLIAVNDYRANTNMLQPGVIFGEDEGLPVLVAKSGNQAGGLGEGRVRDLIAKYISEEKEGVLTPELFNNWKVVGYDWDEAYRAEAVKLINEGKIQIPTSEDGRTPNVRSVTIDDVIKGKASKSVDIISLNDFHGNVKEDAREKGKNMGMAKVINAIKQAKSANPDTIVVAAGDNYQGSAMSNLTHGAPVSEMLKEIETVASAVGNHEFDWGVKWINKWAKDGNFDFLATNIYDKNTGKPVQWAKPYKVVEKGGLKIGFIGLTTPETEYKTKAEHVKNLEFRDLKQATEEWTTYLKSGKAPEGKVDLVIALTHVGSLQDRNTGKITGEVLESGLCEVKGLDAVISGHTHQTVAGRVNGIPVVQGYKYGRAMAKVSIMVDENGAAIGIIPSADLLYKRKSELVADKKGEDIYNKYDEEIKPITSEVVGHTDIELTHDRQSADASVLGKVICDHMRKAANAEIGILNGGGIRTSIPAGDITMGKMYEVLPFDNFIVRLELKGLQIKKAVENGIGNDKISTGQYAGLIVKFDINREFGNRITSIKLEDGTDLDMDKYYTVAVNDFMFNFDNYAQGGDGYDFSGARNISVSADDMRQAVVKGFKGITGENKNTANNIYVVRIGDTLGKIAAKYGTTYKEIAKANDIKNSALIFPGDKLVIPGKTVSEKDNTYTVKAGDTLGSIAQKFGMKYQDIANYNNIKNVNLIFEHQKIVIPSI